MTFRILLTLLLVFYGTDVVFASRHVSQKRNPTKEWASEWKQIEQRFDARVKKASSALREKFAARSKELSQKVQNASNALEKAQHEFQLIKKRKKEHKNEIPRHALDTKNSDALLRSNQLYLALKRAQKVKKKEVLSLESIFDAQKDELSTHKRSAQNNSEISRTELHKELEKLTKLHKDRLKQKAGRQWRQLNEDERIKLAKEGVTERALFTAMGEFDALWLDFIELAKVYGNFATVPEKENAIRSVQGSLIALEGYLKSIEKKESPLSTALTQSIKHTALAHRETTDGRPAFAFEHIQKATRELKSLEFERALQKLRRSRHTPSSF